MPGQFIESQLSIVSQNCMESLKCASVMLHIRILSFLTSDKIPRVQLD